MGSWYSPTVNLQHLANVIGTAPVNVRANKNLCLSYTRQQVDGTEVLSREAVALHPPAAVGADVAGPLAL